MEVSSHALAVLILQKEAPVKRLNVPWTQTVGPQDETKILPLPLIAPLFLVCPVRTPTSTPKTAVPNTTLSICHVKLFEDEPYPGN